MKLFKYLFLLILMLVLATLAYVAVLDSEFEIEKEIQLKAPRALVFQEINQLKKWEEWSSISKNSDAFSFSEKTQGEQASLSWENENAKTSGKLQNIKVEHDSHIHQEGFSEKSIGKTNYDYLWNLRQETDTTVLRLNLKGKLNFNAKILRLLKSKKDKTELTNSLDADLERLKENVLAKMRVYSVNVDGVKEMPSRTFIYTSISTKNQPEILSKQREVVFEKLKDFLRSEKLSAEENPFMLFNSIDKTHDNVIVSFGIPINVTKDLEIEDSENNILMGSNEPQKVIKSTLKGDYQNIAKLWEATRVYMQENHLKQDREAQAYEVFKITSADSENPAEWITELYVPIEERETPLIIDENLEL